MSVVGVKCRKRRMTERQKAYLAGLFDGEACINIYKSKTGFIARIDLGMADEDLIYQLHKETKVGSVVRRVHKHKKNIFNWCIQANGCRDILPSLLPYLRSKKKQTEVVMDFLYILDDYKHRKVSKSEYLNQAGGFYTQLKSLNQRGKQGGKK